MKRISAFLKQLFQSKRMGPALIVLIVLALSVANLIKSPSGLPIVSNPSLTPTPTPKAPLIIRSKTSIIKNQEFSTFSLSQNFVYPEIPVSLPVFNSRLETLDLRNTAKEIAALYKLSPHPKIENYWTNEKNTLLLNLEKGSNNLLLIRNMTADTKPWSSSTQINLSRLTDMAQSFLQQFPLTQNLELETDGISFYSSDPTSYEYVPTTSQKANLVQFNFSPVKLTYKTRIESQSFPFVSLLLNPDGEILKLQILSQKITADSNPTNYPLLTRQELTDKLLAGDMEMISASVPDLVGSKTKAGVVLLSVDIEYRFNQNKLLLAPYFVVKANLYLDNQTETSPATFLLPAITKL
jgi:hypothetical protein